MFNRTIVKTITIMVLTSLAPHAYANFEEQIDCGDVPFNELTVCGVQVIETNSEGKRAYAYDSDMRITLGKENQEPAIKDLRTGNVMAVDKGVLVVADHPWYDTPVYVVETDSEGERKVTKLYRNKPRKEQHWLSSDFRAGFGRSVDVHDGVIVVGEPNIRGDYDDGGSVYVYEKNRGGDYDRFEIKAPISDMEKGFGSSVAINGALVVVGAASEIDGKVYLYRKNPEGGYSLKTTIEPKDPKNVSDFGRSVAINNGLIAVSSELNTYIYEIDSFGIKETKFPGFSNDVAIDNGVIVVARGGDGIMVLEKNQVGEYETTNFEFSQKSIFKGASGEHYYSKGIWFDHVDVGDGIIAATVREIDNEKGSKGRVYVIEKSPDGKYAHKNVLTAEYSDGMDYTTIDDGELYTGVYNFGSRVDRIVRYSFGKRDFSYFLEDMENKVLEISNSTPPFYSSFYKSVYDMILELRNGPLEIEARSYVVLSLKSVILGSDSPYFINEVHDTFRMNEQRIYQELNVSDISEIPTSKSITSYKINAAAYALNSVKNKLVGQQAAEIHELILELSRISASYLADSSGSQDALGEFYDIVEVHSGLFEDLMRNKRTMFVSEFILGLTK